jgi:hypothetical protein
LIFVTLTNILLITSLISLLSNSLSRVSAQVGSEVPSNIEQILEHAREEYLFIYAVYVLEASTSNRLTYFFPPFNLIPLFMRPARLVVAPEKLRKARILLLKVTHAPLVAAIWAYEGFSGYFGDNKHSTLSRVASLGGPSDTGSLKRLPQLSSFTPRSPIAQGTSARMKKNNKEGARSSPRLPTTTVEQEDDLKGFVIQLSAQVAELKAMMAEQHAQQNVRPPGR